MRCQAHALGGHPNGALARGGARHTPAAHRRLCHEHLDGTGLRVPRIDTTVELQAPYAVGRRLELRGVSYRFAARDTLDHAQLGMLGVTLGRTASSGAGAIGRR